MQTPAPQVTPTQQQGHIYAFRTLYSYRCSSSSKQTLFGTTYKHPLSCLASPPLTIQTETAIIPSTCQLPVFKLCLKRLGFSIWRVQNFVSLFLQFRLCSREGHRFPITALWLLPVGSLRRLVRDVGRKEVVWFDSGMKPRACQPLRDSEFRACHDKRASVCGRDHEYFQQRLPDVETVASSEVLR